MLYTVRELECKDVINICDGKILGHVTDIELEGEQGRVCAFLVSNGLGFWIGSRDLLRIPWEQVKCIGEDTILVEYRREISNIDKNKCKGWFR